MIGDLPQYKLEKFIHGIVAKLIRSYRMNDFVIQSPTGSIDSDVRQDMVQTGWVAALQCQKSHPEESKNPHYLRRAVVNSLLKYEQSGRYRRDNQDECLSDNEHVIAADNLEPRMDIAYLTSISDLSPAEARIIDLFYGLSGNTEHPIQEIATLMDKPPGWVTQRLRVARLKLQVAAGH